ncbi:MAG: nitrogen fixation protein NifZ [Burkholderiales bacterium]
MMEPRIPKYQWGQPVVAIGDMYNDGSFPEQAEDALLVSEGSPGEVVQVGHHEESNTPVYMVEFQGGIVVGCLEEEITPK